MRDLVYCEKCGNWACYKRDWNLSKQCCEDCAEKEVEEESNCQIKKNA